ncbi:MAG TPA: urate oxidase [Tepidisphaeraceae bacterium]|jgi:urate oxidase|nr:urate oxidase [Tepidisphaeraceae bacterium]
MPTLGFNSYGKSRVRLTKVVRNGPVHELFEIDAAIQLQGDFGAAYTAGDNRDVVATDSIKNTVYVLAKEHAFTSVEQFAMMLSEHFVKTYPQVSSATVELQQATYERISVDGRPHDHAFTVAGPQKRLARATLVRGGSASVVGGIHDLIVLKTTASEWRDFVTDRYRTLKDTRDRIMATKVSAEWNYTTVGVDYNAACEAINKAIVTTFATTHSLGVQQTLMDMGDAALAASDAIEQISFTLPNLHRIPFNLEPFGLKFDNDIYVATDEPHGLITGTITRK